MKKDLIFGIIGSLLTLLLVAYFSVGYLEKKSSALSLPSGNNSGGVNTVLTAELVKAHNLPADCWIIVNKNVYDVTNYLTTHPGGAGRITPFCGLDATTAYDTKDGQGTHSQKANNDLFALKVGTIGEPVGNISPAVLPTVAKSAAAPKPTTSTKTNITLTLDVIKKHNSAGDCWIIISNKVYNVTGYLAAHPGGASIIIPYCGADATTAFDTKAGKGSHSSFTQADLAVLLIGSVGTSVQTGTIQQTVNNAAQIATSSSRNREEENEDD